MAQGVGNSEEMADAPTDDPTEAESAPTALWSEVREDIRELFGENVEFTVEEFNDHTWTSR